MKKLITFVVLFVSGISFAAPGMESVDLFESGDLSKWKIARADEGWSVSNGVVALDQPGAGWLISRNKYKDFQLDFEWKISEGGNSGVMYRTRGRGLEYQILDDEKHIRGKKPISSAGALYDLEPPIKNKPYKPAGQWNSGRIVALGDHIEHWLNGAKILEVKLSGEDWSERFRKSKYSEYVEESQYGHAESSIAFQDHGHVVWYRNVRIRELVSKIPDSGSARKPNVILIFADDISARELPVYGSSVWSPPQGGDTSDPQYRAQTPALDRLAQEGCWIETAWASTCCSPSRAAMMTGRYAHLHKWWDNKDYGMIENDRGQRRVWPLYESSPRLIGHVAEQGGYATQWVGKTQMKGADLKRFGFQEGVFCQVSAAGLKAQTDFKLIQKKGSDQKSLLNADTGELVKGYAQTSYYWKPAVALMNRANTSSPFKLWPDTDESRKNYGLSTYGPDVELEYIFDFMRRSSELGKPFFVYHTSHLGHDAFDWLHPKSNNKWPGTPVIHWDGERYTRIEPKVTGDDGVYDTHGTVTESGIHSHIEYLDYQVWLYRNKLEELGAADNTIFIFAADNGTSGYGKHSPDQQKGTHVPLIIYAPGMTKQGKQPVLADVSDLLPTLAEIGGVELPSDYEINGKSLLPFLFTEERNHRDWIYAYNGAGQLIRGKHVLRDARGKWWDVTAQPDDLISFPEIKDWSQVSAEHRAERDRLKEIASRYDAYSTAHDP